MKGLKDDKIKYEVLALDHSGTSHTDISKATGIPKTTVRDFLSKESYLSWWAEHGEKILELFGQRDTGPNIYLLDIETSPIEAYVWGLYDQNISHNHIIKDWEILCVCYRKLGVKEPTRISTALEYLKNPQDAKKLGEPMTHQQLAQRLWEVLNDADIIIAHNGIKFDNRKIRAKLKLAGLPPPRPYKVFDTLKVCRSNFGFTSNRKDYLSKVLGGDGKLDTGGMKLWIDCLNGDFDAWQKMIDYCGVDLDELERIYLEVRAWDNKHPNLQLYFKDSQERCGTCGSMNLLPIEDKVAVTSTSAYELVGCQDCGAPM